MSNRQTINTDGAPAAVGVCSQAVKAGRTVYISGQIPVSLDSKGLVSDDFRAQVLCCLENLKAVAEASGGELQDVAKMGVYLTDLSRLDQVDEVMADYFSGAWPARVVVGVAALPERSLIQVDAVLELK